MSTLAVKEIRGNEFFAGCAGTLKASSNVSSKRPKYQRTYGMVWVEFVESLENSRERAANSVPYVRSKMSELPRARDTVSALIQGFRRCGRMREFRRLIFGVGLPMGLDDLERENRSRIRRLD